jgi:hypothetical protein
MREDVYLWEQDSEDLAKVLFERVKKQHSYLKSTGVFDNAAKSMRFYYGQFYAGQYRNGLGSAGDQGELITTAVNQYRSLVRHSLDLTTQEQLVFDATSENNDPATRDAAILSESILNSYFYERDYREDVFNTFELAALCGTAYLEVYWEDQQKLMGADGDGQLVFVGTPKFRSRSFLDVTVDKLFESDWRKQNWVIVRDTENRWDLIRRTPKMRDEILRLPAASDDDVYNSFCEEDDVWVFRAYHRECAALPLGRAIYFFEDGTVYREFTRNGKNVNPYCDPKATWTPNGGLPLMVARPQVRHGCHHGYSKAWDLLPLQEAHNLLASTIITNQANFALTHIAVPREANLNRAILGGGTAIYEYDLLDGGAGVPTPLNLLSTPSEVFKHLEDQEMRMETIYGINAITRGKIDTSIPPTGVAAAILASQGQIMNSDLEKCWQGLVKQSAVFLLYIISRFQKWEETVKVVGRDKLAMSKKFSGSSVNGIKNVRINVGNPLAKTTAGRTAMMEVMMQYGMIKTPEQAMEVIETGNVRSQMEFVTAENKYIRDENDIMMGGGEPLGLGSDNHVKHFLQHKIVLDNPQVRNDPKILQLVTAHMEFHADQIDIQSQNNPLLFSMILTDGGKVPMPIPDQSTGMVPQGGEAVGIPTSQVSAEESESLQQLSSPMGTNAAQATDATNSKALEAVRSAETKIAQQSGEIG